jgi:HAMP domain-containing protein
VTTALLVLCAGLFVNMLFMMRTLNAHQRHLAALDESVRAQRQHLAAHDGGLALLRQGRPR